MTIILKLVSYEIKHIQCDVCLTSVEAVPTTPSGIPEGWAGWAEFAESKDAQHVCPDCSRKSLQAAVSEARRK